MTSINFAGSRQVWDFEKATQCFNCGKEAIQHIEVRPDETVITCMNCGAARHYTIDGISLEETFDEDVPKGPSAHQKPS